MILIYILEQNACGCGFYHTHREKVTARDRREDATAQRFNRGDVEKINIDVWYLPLVMVFTIVSWYLLGRTIVYTITY